MHIVNKPFYCRDGQFGPGKRLCFSISRKALNDARDPYIVGLGNRKYRAAKQTIQEWINQYPKESYFARSDSIIVSLDIFEPIEQEPAATAAAPAKKQEPDLFGGGV